MMNNRVMHTTWARAAHALGICMLMAMPMAQADTVVDWNIRAVDIANDAKLGAPTAGRVLAMVQTAVFEASNAISHRYPASASAFKLVCTNTASQDAAVAAASRSMLIALLPGQQSAIETHYQTALTAMADGAPRREGIRCGEQASAAVLAARGDEERAFGESYRPHVSAGAYVPTVTPVFSQWPLRKPWLMSNAAQFRPGPPPKLNSELWARDYNESKAMGGKNSARRNAEQTVIARFWEATGPAIYHGVLRSLANLPGRELTQNARLFAAACQAADDAIIAVFDAKYQYNFWRPLTAIRNGDIDGNDATERDAVWLPLIDTPMHPEYPCAHCISAGSIGIVLRAEIAGMQAPRPIISTASPTAKGATRSWSSVDDFIQEVSDARVYDGVHFRNSTEVGTDMGKKIGALAVEKFY